MNPHDKVITRKTCAQSKNKNLTGLLLKYFSTIPERNILTGLSQFKVKKLSLSRPSLHFLVQCPKNQ